MTTLAALLEGVSMKFIPILDARIPRNAYTPIDLSAQNTELKTLDITKVENCQTYIDSVLAAKSAQVAYGGYLEQRNLYLNNPNFNSENEALRNVHLGVDFWAKAGTEVLMPLNGVLHSFCNNSAKGDYGPTLILQHELAGVRFYSLFGHLSLASLEGLYEGKSFQAGEVLGTLGTPDSNGNYAPHLHFQLILNLGSYFDNYPGVCTTKDKEYYSINCPNPLLLLHL
ncbi:peptidoglycan DD-metalloendopeptidase family protein [Arenibacter sp. GZD96]|uniref:peptidoglycan DD-metalloendopeptidase family protein n=1 Tax=Aurantibrevibacter litoralis TaxID=3106030 RepID=UPI002AFE25F9|nr:peptidoglycan DD-metalloendopeptidase family protein [Arenibacter sp. GZD-96]MEA1785031.1 peptidoglycan DD-metalloendopeptidase family protein [Arenibacter sp. GZD-96]